jgi:heme exporter protein C
MNAKLNQRITLLNRLSFAGLLSLIAMIWFFAPVELNMGNVHRILYFHVGTAWVAAVTFFIALIAGILYLRSRNDMWDILSMGSVEIGLVFFTITIAAGSVWAKSTWGEWWVWSPRLILVTVMWLVYVAYFVLRGAVDEKEKRARFAAVYVGLAFVTVIVTYMSIRIFRDIHPVVVGGVTESVAAANAAEGNSDFSSGIESMRMGLTLAWACVVFSLIYVAWLAHRYRLQRLLDQVELLKSRVMTRLQG